MFVVQIKSLILIPFLSFLLSFFLVGVPDVGEMMAASFPADSKFSADLSLDNAWYSFIIIISSLVLVFIL